MNVFEYLTHTKFEKIGDSITELDLFVFTLLSYTKFEYLPSKMKLRRLTIGKYCEYYLEELKKRGFGKKEHRELIAALKDNERYKDVRIVQLVSNFDQKEEKQYASITFKVGKKNFVLAYRGTDSTLIGWKEDINLAVKDAIPSEILATHVLDSLLRRHPFSRVYVTGHSKGGVLALYASSHIIERRQKRIVSVSEYDGPGLKLADILDSNYEKIIKRIHGYLPEHAIVGLIFHKKHPITIIKSNAKSILEHDPFSWEIENGHFYKLEEYESREALKPGVINKVMTMYTDSELTKIIEMIYELTKDDGRAITLPEIAKKDKIKDIYHRYKNLEKDDRKMLRKVAWEIVFGAYREF